MAGTLPCCKGSLKASCKFAGISDAFSLRLVPIRIVCCRRKYGFKALEYHAKGFEDKAAYKKVHGSDLYIVDIDEYDRICKVKIDSVIFTAGLSACIC